MKKCLRLCKDAETHGWDSWLTYDWQAAKAGTRGKHVEEPKSHANCCTTGQKSQAGQAVSSNSRLGPVMRPSHQTTLFRKNWLFTFLSHLTMYGPLYLWNIESFQREFWERNHREKQDWFIHNLHIDSSNSSTFFLSIVTSLRGTLPKPFLTLPISVKRPFGALGSN